MINVTEHNPASTRSVGVASVAKRLFVSLGILPLLLCITLIYFAVNEPRFLSLDNLSNVMRVSTFLIIVAMGQMLVILTAGLDLSVGSIIGFVGVVTASLMLYLLELYPDSIGLVITLSVVGGLFAGMLVGAINGVGVSVLKVSPFMMTLGTMTSLVGVSLSLTSGLPVTGIPDEFMQVLGYGRVLGMTPPVLITLVLFVAIWILLNRTTTGRYFYAVGANLRAAQLSGIATKRQLFLAYVMAGLLASVVGVLFLARTGSAEALNGSTFGLQAIAACVIGGVSLFGGIGKVRDVLLGALFITILTNGMDLIRVESYVQQIVLGIVLILSLVADQFRLRWTC
ncbi:MULTISPECIES: ABC transporter permease [unclassified Pseudomonas]|uniref:ABC transporter permease n=1 Tax=Pseudomonas TaxID=286 RepID=UPI0008716517|nr:MULTISPECIES: ABC transporter permease [unclassified Pseudomonas]SCW35845.1 ribose transport system permease protein [Pseudomonas sp. NFACC56-3]SFK16514.1 ribose transport system permease protein [Pseudomonas sp. NFACC52]